MNVRTLIAPSMTEALALVKQQVGRHAVVLHTRSIKQGGWLGIGRRTLIEVTAADGREVARARRQQSGESPRARVLRQAAEARGNVAVPNAQEQKTAGDLIRRTYQAARTQFDAASPSLDAAFASSLDPTTASAAINVAEAPPQSVSFSRPDSMEKELYAVRQLVEQVMQNQHITQSLVAAPPTQTLPDPLVAMYGSLIEQEVSAQLADELVREIDPGASDEMDLAMRQQIIRRLQIDPQAGQVISAESGRPRVIALVGPTGVGKTTTVAKLAAMMKLKQNKKVGLITADTYRIAAVEQLRTYGQIIGLPLEIVSGPAEMSAALQKMSDFDAVLIDTAGRSQRNTDRLDELNTLLSTADPHETHLVLSSTASQRVLQQIADRFEAVRTDRVIFTKIDEAVTCGAMLNIAQRIGKPLSYVTTGQEVPHQIEACDAQRLADWIMGKDRTRP